MTRDNKQKKPSKQTAVLFKVYILDNNWRKTGKSYTVLELEWKLINRSYHNRVLRKKKKLYNNGFFSSSFRV